jgi:hypothetical protein
MDSDLKSATEMSTTIVTCRFEGRAYCDLDVAEEERFLFPPNFPL